MVADKVLVLPHCLLGGAARAVARNKRVFETLLAGSSQPEPPVSAQMVS